ncbi:MAG: NifU family protein [Planctomycetes bacterium]|nr:NifU family protein [Planctomycetota bacterium]
MTTGQATQVHLTPIARTKLQEYLSQEPSETAVRILIEDDGRFGLSLDTEAQGDARFEVEAIPFIVEGEALPALDGLKVDYLEQGAASGFSLTGGRPRPARTVLRTEPTPNPNAMKFVLSFSQGRTSQTFTRDKRAEAPAVLGELFDIDGVEQVFALDTFVTITRAPGADWDALVPPAREVLSKLTPPQLTAATGPASDAFEDRLAHFIRTDVAPFLQSDGGDIELVGVEDGIVNVRLVGACGSCPSSIATLQFGVERRLKEQFPAEVKGLKLVEGPGGGHGHHGHHHH